MFVRIGIRDRKRQTGRTRAEKHRETFLPYVPQILGQLDSEYLKNAVYLTCGRQLLTLSCSKTQRHMQTNTNTFSQICTPHTHFMNRITMTRCLFLHKTEIPHTHSVEAYTSCYYQTERKSN